MRTWARGVCIRQRAPSRDAVAGWTYASTARAAGSARLAATTHQAWSDQATVLAAAASTAARPSTSSGAAPPAAEELQPQAPVVPPPQLPQQPQQQQWGAPPTQVLQQIAAAAVAGNKGAGSGASLASAGSGAPIDPNDLATTYQLAFHLAQMYPDLYKQAMAATTARPAPNLNFTSDWGDSLAK